MSRFLWFTVYKQRHTTQELGIRA